MGIQFTYDPETRKARALQAGFGAAPNTRFTIKPIMNGRGVTLFLEVRYTREITVYFVSQRVINALAVNSSGNLNVHSLLQRALKEALENSPRLKAKFARRSPKNGLVTA